MEPLLFKDVLGSGNAAFGDNLEKIWDELIHKDLWRIPKLCWLKLVWNTKENMLELSNPLLLLQNRNQPTRKIAKIVKNWFKVLLEVVRFGVQSVAWKLSSDY